MTATNCRSNHALDRHGAHLSGSGHVKGRGSNTAPFGVIIRMDQSSVSVALSRARLCNVRSPDSI